LEKKVLFDLAARERKSRMPWEKRRDRGRPAHERRRKSVRPDLDQKRGRTPADLKKIYLRWGGAEKEKGTGCKKRKEDQVDHVLGEKKGPRRARHAPNEKTTMDAEKKRGGDGERAKRGGGDHIDILQVYRSICAKGKGRKTTKKKNTCPPDRLFQGRGKERRLCPCSRQKKKRRRRRSASRKSQRKGRSATTS